MKKHDILILSVILLGLVLIRVVFDIPNFNPLGAVALMGGLLVGRKAWAFLLPLGALFLGDLLLGLSSPMYADYLFSTSFVFVYASFGLMILLGSSFNGRVNLKNVLIGSFGAAVIFFLVSNAGSWLAYEMYPKTLTGLVAAFEAGIPFFRNTLISQVVFSVAIYLTYSLASSRKVAIA